MADIFNIGISGLISAQRQLSTTSHNISNVNTDGYSRQRVGLVQLPGQASGDFFLGAGVQVAEVARTADQFLIGQLRNANTNEANADKFVGLASRIDNLLGDGSFNTSLDTFFSSLHDANANPSSTAEREVFLAAAGAFVTRFNDFEQRLSAMARDVNNEIVAAVAEINTLSEAIADVNDSIVRALGRSQGAAPNDLLDQRERLIGDLAKLVGVETLEQEDGALNVFVGSGQMLVAGSTSLPLSTVPNTLDVTRLEVSTSVGGTNSLISQLIRSGELGATLNFREDLLDPARNEIGRLAAVLAMTFNEQHREGLDLNDNFGLDFFSIGTPDISADPTNTGSVSLAFDPTAPSDLTAADYRLNHDGTNFILTNLTDNSTQTLTGAGPFNVDGLIITVTAAPAAGDTYLLQPTKTVARAMNVLVSNASDVALARPNRTFEADTNIGNAEIGAPVVLDVTDPALLTPVQLVFNDPPTTYQVGGVGPLIPYTSGTDIDINGWRVQISGSPEPGDTFHIDPNFGGAGDNGNGLLLADLQLTKIVDGLTATYQESYSQLVGTVGGKTAQTEISRDALRVLRENAQAARDSISAVNLDEEAAQLLRFQQAFSAAAEVISIANENFDSLIAAVRG